MKPMKNFDELLEIVATHPVRRVAVAVAHDLSVIQAAAEARKRDIAEAVLVGQEKEIRELAESAEVSLDGTEIVDEADPVRAVDTAVQWVSGGKADVLMKGSPSVTDTVP